MNCSDRDQDLLLYEHGALSGWQRLRTEWHLRQCPRCQERCEQLGAVGSLMAAAIRESDMPLPVFPGTVIRAEAVAKTRPMPAARPAFLVTVAGVAAVIAAVALAYKATALAMPIDADKVPPHVTYIYRGNARSRPNPRPVPTPAPGADCPPPKASAIPVPGAPTSAVPALSPRRGSCPSSRPAESAFSATVAASYNASAATPPSLSVPIAGRTCR